jgi:fatty-acyl-CoA synthase
MPANTPDGGSRSIVEGQALREEPGLGALTIGGFLKEISSRYGTREALVLHAADPTADAAIRWSYTALWDRALEVARALLAVGVGKDTRVGVLMTNRPEFLASVFGIALAGGVTVTLNTFCTPSELDYLLKASCISVLLFENQVLKKDFASMLVELEPAIETAQPGSLLSGKYPYLRRLVHVDDLPTALRPTIGFQSWQDFLRRGLTVPASQVELTAASVQPSDTGMLFFSSGTTSSPKGILHAHRAVAVQWWRWPRVMSVENGDVRVWTANAFFWSGNFSMVLGCGLATGGTVVLQRTFQPEEALALMQAEAVTLPLAWPHQWAKLEGAGNWQQADLSAIRYVDPDVPLGRHPTVRHTGWYEPPAYGATETLTIVASTPIRSPEDRLPHLQGPPLPGNTIKIVDPTGNGIVPRGERGEIAVKGPTLMLGYLGTPLDETLDAEGFYRTGDSGYVDASNRLFWEGRLTDLIKTGGANVSPREIDGVMMSIAGVKLSRTIGVPHRTLGEMVVSCIVPHAGATLDAAALQRFLKERLASYKLPREILFLREEDLSMTGGSDKVKAGALIKLATERLAGGRG